MTPKPLPLTHLGFVPNDRTVTFYRVEEHGGHFVADFATRAEAESFAASDARAKRCRYDHKVSQIILRGRRNP